MVKMLDTHLSGCPSIPRSEQDDGTTCPDCHVCRMFAEGKVTLARSEEHGYYLVTCWGRRPESAAGFLSSPKGAVLPDAGAAPGSCRDSLYQFGLAILNPRGAGERTIGAFNVTEGTDRRIDKAGSEEAQIERDASDLHHLGYQQKLQRTIGAYASFALGFSMISITTTIFTLFADPFQKIGGVGIWLWIVVTLGVLAITAVYAHLAARLPVTGYAYQWTSRLVSSDYGWFCGWTALLSSFVGTASIAVAMGTVFAPEFWETPTHRQIAGLAAVAILGAVAVNIISIRAVTWFNNVGASAELVGTLGLTLVTAVGLFFFQNKQGFKVLFQVGSSLGGPVNITTVGLAMLLPVYTLMGWEGSAGLAEETRDPRRTAPSAMFRSVIISGICAVFVYAVFAMAIPGSIEATANQNGNALISVFQSHFGRRPTFLLKAVAFISILSALLANVTVATRMCFSLARDHMLPGSGLLGRVDPVTRTPIYCTLLVGAVSLFVNLLSRGIIQRVVGIVAVTYYGTYIFTLAAALIGVRRGTMPAAPAGYFYLGRWLRPLAFAGIAWSLIVIGYMTLPETNRVAGEYTIYFELAGALWYAFYLRRKLRGGRAGPPAVPAHAGSSAATGA